MPRNQSEEDNGVGPAGPQQEPRGGGERQQGKGNAPSSPEVRDLLEYYSHGPPHLRGSKKGGGWGARSCT